MFFSVSCLYSVPLPHPCPLSVLLYDCISVLQTPSLHLSPPSSVPLTSLAVCSTLLLSFHSPDPKRQLQPWSTICRLSWLLASGMGAAVALGMETAGNSSSIRTSGCHMARQAGRLERRRGTGDRRPCPLSRHRLPLRPILPSPPSVRSPLPMPGPPPRGPGPHARASNIPHLPAGLLVFPPPSFPPTAGRWPRDPQVLLDPDGSRPSGP